MSEQGTLFDMTPDESTGVLEKTEIEYLLLAFADSKKRHIIVMMEKLLRHYGYDVYPDLLYELVKIEYESLGSGGT